MPPLGKTFEFPVADCNGFVTVGEYNSGQPGEIFITVSKQGSTLAGIMDAFAKSISYGLQYGVPLRGYVEAFVNMKFEPAGMTDDPDVRFAGSIMDYLFRRLALEYLTYDKLAELGIFTIAERTQPTLPGVDEAVIETHQGSEWCPTRRPCRRCPVAAGMQSGAVVPTVEDNTPPAASHERAIHRCACNAACRWSGPAAATPARVGKHQRLQLTTASRRASPAARPRNPPRPWLGERDVAVAVASSW